MRRNRYRREINDKKYEIKIFDGRFHTTVRIESVGPRRSRKRYVKRRKWLCDDVERFVANMLAEAVNIREDIVEERAEYNNRIEDSLDVVQEEYDED